MPRAIWKGSLSFGPVNVPVGLNPATMDKTLPFHEMEAGTADRICYRKVTATNY
jgi:DNA end-binding protein Ku